MASIQHICVAYDGSLLSEQALHSAVRRTAGSHVAQIHVVCVAERLGQLVRLPSGELLPHWAALGSLRLIVKRTARLGAEGAKLPHIFVHLRIGEPGPVIVDLAYRFHTELILMGAGRSPESHRVGSVATRVLELSEIPVELETPLGKSAAAPPFNALRFAYVFGGPALRRDNLGRPGGAGAASA
jgi:nucleotide-binding universal stress UspA family protein